MDADAKRALATDIDAVARLQGSFVLRSGAVATEYFDKYRFEADPALLARVAQAMIPLLPADTEVLAGVPIATAMSLATGLPCAFVRKQAKTYGTCLAVEGSEVKGRRVVMIEDVISTGGAVRDAAVHLADAGAVLTAVVCTLWRGDGEPRIEGLAVPLLAAFRKEDLERR